MRPAAEGRVQSASLGLLAAIVTALQVFAAEPASLEQARARLNAAEQDRAAALGEQQTAAQKAAVAAAEATRLAAERAVAEVRLRDARRATTAAAAKMQALERARRDAEERVASETKALEPLLPVLERLSRYPAETMLAVSLPPEDAIRGVSVLHAVAGAIGQRVEELRKEQAALRVATEQLAAAAPALSAAEAAQATAAADLARQTAFAEAARRTAEEAASAAGRRAAQLGAEATGLRALLGKLQAEEARGERQAAKRKVAMAIPMHAPGRLLTPVTGAVIRHFGDPAEVGRAEGISYRTEAGARVAAPCGGRVMFAAPFRSYRNLIILDCGGGTDLVLAGLKRFAVKAGELVGAGGVLGEMPDDNPVLYLELRRAGEPADPASWLKSAS